MKILFVGNSYTYFNGMPDKFAALCTEKGIDVTVHSVTKGGYSFAHYLSEGNEKAEELRLRLSENSYDIIVLQEQSVRPAAYPDSFLCDARRTCELVKANGAKPVFYQTWGRREGNETLEKNGWTHEKMHALLKKAYLKAADENGASVVLAGDSLREAYARGVDVYHPDGSHPSDEGSAVIAKAFFDALIENKKI